MTLKRLAIASAALLLPATALAAAAATDACSCFLGCC